MFFDGIEREYWPEIRDWNNDRWSVKTGGSLKKPVMKILFILKMKKCGNPGNEDKMKKNIYYENCGLKWYLIVVYF